MDTEFSTSFTFSVGITTALNQQLSAGNETLLLSNSGFSKIPRLTESCCRCVLTRFITASVCLKIKKQAYPKEIDEYIRVRVIWKQIWPGNVLLNYSRTTEQFFVSCLASFPQSRAWVGEGGRLIPGETRICSSTEEEITAINYWGRF